jgi:hypothetical protein
MKKRFLYCIDQHADVYLQGTRDSDVRKQEHSYIVIEVWRCNDDTKPEGFNGVCKPDRMLRLLSDPSAPPVDAKTILEADLDKYYEDLQADTIDNWLREKKVELKVLN